jgi:hypothetical protein
MGHSFFTLCHCRNCESRQIPSPAKHIWRILQPLKKSNVHGHIHYIWALGQCIICLVIPLFQACPKVRSLVNNPPMYYSDCTYCQIKLLVLWTVPWGTSCAHWHGWYVLEHDWLHTDDKRSTDRQGKTLLLMHYPHLIKYVCWWSIILTMLCWQHHLIYMLLYYEWW